MKWWNDLPPVMKDIIGRRAAEVMCANGRGFYPPLPGALSWDGLLRSTNPPLDVRTQYNTDLRAHCALGYLEMREAFGIPFSVEIMPP